METKKYAIMPINDPKLMFYIFYEFRHALNDIKHDVVIVICRIEIRIPFIIKLTIQLLFIKDLNRRQQSE